ncbi:LuxE/PaaK family acyltransferase [Bacillus sp. 7884-1]|uniref:LuxE/PaaK family acyltransferase n=1 Tax=Bacillus sp. 7884-1 TaxID=2021693 RepID=UPI000BA5DFA3|nr:hypothetical protein [Bacillus sp. 7884-1]PAE38026.1 hypothetical protein CHI06_19160 [Bacillus sp. 7884-1]
MAALLPIDDNALNAVGNWNLTKEQFLIDLRNTLIDSVNECEAYRFLCKEQDFDANRDLQTIDDLTKIPYITSQTFKRSVGLYSKLLRIPVKEIDLWTLSSSTSGDPSLSGRRWKDVGTYQRSYLTVYPRLFGTEPLERCLMFWPDPKAMRASIGLIDGKKAAPFASYIIDSERFTKEPTKTQYLLELNQHSKKLEVNVPVLLEGLREADKDKGRTLLIGSTPLLYLTIVDHYKRTGETFHLGPNTFILAGAGGWDGKKGQVNIGRTISKEAFVSDLMQILGILPKHIIDRFGFSESSATFAGHYNSNLRDFIYEIPPWAHILVRDPFTLKPISEFGKEGLLEVITPYGMSTHTGTAILVDDLVSLVDPSIYGSKRTTIRIHGRVPHSHKAGCGVMFE